MSMAQSPEFPDAYEVLGVDSLSQVMSHVSLNTIDITRFMKPIWDSMEMANVREDLKKKIEEHCRELERKNGELSNLVLGQRDLVGARNLIWDIIIGETNKVCPYLGFIKDKENTIQASIKHIQAAQCDLHKIPLDTVESAIKFLNSLTYEDIR